MSSIDERIVRMQFDNQQFESGVKTSLNTLDRLKKALKLDEAAKNVSNLQKVGNNFSLSGMASGVETIANRFSTLGIIGVTALQNITTAAMRAGAQIAKSLTLDPVMTGLTEYETKMNAITTILTNTQSKGTTLDDVNKALSELNTYADQTIYNFAEMTRNIGTFTAAGVDLDTSVKAIKGIANLAAGSGSTATQASTAMYQLSQAIAAGRVSLEDWNSVVNAGMGGEMFQNALKETAKQMGIVVDESVSFRESISAAGGGTSWLTSDVLVKTLESFADNDTLVKAATQVKTITQLFDTMKESVQSGWAQSWEYIIGDRDQAIETLTAVSDAFNDIIGPSTDARNEMLKFWNQNGGRAAIIDAMANSFKALSDILTPIGKAFRDVIPPMTGEKLVDISEKIKSVTEGFKVSNETMENIQRTFRGVFSAMDLVRKGIGTILSPITKLGGGLKSLSGFLLEVTAGIGDFFTELNESDTTAEFLGTVSNSLSNFLGGVSDTIGLFTSSLGGVGEVIGKFGDGILKVLEGIMTALGDLLSGVTSKISLGTIFAGLFTGGALSVGKKAGNFFDTISDAVEGFFGIGDMASKVSDNFAATLGKIQDALTSFTTSIKAKTLLTIAAAVGILAIAIGTLSTIKADKLGVALAGITVMLFELRLSFTSLLKTLKQWPSKGLIGASISLIAIAGAIAIMSGALKSISSLSLEETAQGLGAIAVMLAELSLFLKATDLKGASLKGALSLVVIAGAVTMLSDVIIELSTLSWEGIAKGLTTLAGALVGLVASIKVINKTKISVSTSLAIIALATSCTILADALEQFSSMSWEEIAKGLATMAGALIELTAVTAVLGKTGGGKSLLSSISIFVVTQSLEDIANALERLGSMSWEEIGKGLSAMGGALAELGIVTGALGNLAGFSGILGGGALVLAAQALEPIAEALENIGSLSWEEIGRGLAGMGGALLEVSVITGALGMLTGLSGMLGAGAILIGVQGLGTLADALEQFGEMTWEEIGRGLVGMGGALAELAIISGLLGALSPLSMLGSGSILIGVQGLGTLADALKKFGQMDWDEIGRGIVAMGGALGAAGLGALLNTFSGFGAGAISEMAEPLGVLADSVKKWEGVSVPDDLAWQLGTLANGVMRFTLSGFGASALSEAAPALDALADAIKKWSGVTIPDGLDTGLKSIADGVSAFSWTFLGGISMEVIRGPLSKLPNAIKKWKDVTVPSGIDKDLESLADGIKSFTGTMFAGWSIGTVIDPLKQLASAVKKWDGIYISTSIGEGLSGLATGLTALSGTSYSEDFSGLGTGLASLATATMSLNSANLIAAGNSLMIFGNAIAALPSRMNLTLSSMGTVLITSINSMTAQLISAGPRFLQAGTTMAAQLSVGLRMGLTTSGSVANVAVLSMVAQLTSRSSMFRQAGVTLISAFSLGVTAGFGSLGSMASNAISQIFTLMLATAQKTILSARMDFHQYGSTLIIALSNGMKQRQGTIATTMNAIVRSAVDNARSYENSFYSVGRNMVQGLANGIRSNRSSAITAASNVASDALKAAQDTLDVNSPSKEMEWVGEQADLGLVYGLLALQSRVEQAGRAIGTVALYAISGVMDNVSAVVDSGMSISPTITPVVDMTEVTRSMQELDAMMVQKDKQYALNGIATRNLSGIQNGIRSAREINRGTPSYKTENNYNQYITSPKPLTRSEIYRQSKNLFSLEKGGGSGS